VSDLAGAAYRSTASSTAGEPRQSRRSPLPMPASQAASRIGTAPPRSARDLPHQGRATGWPSWCSLPLCVLVLCHPACISLGAEVRTRIFQHDFPCDGDSSAMTACREHRNFLPIHHGDADRPAPRFVNLHRIGKGHPPDAQRRGMQSGETESVWVPSWGTQTVGAAKTSNAIQAPRGAGDVQPDVVSGKAESDTPARN